MAADEASQERVHAQTREQWRAWLAQNHARRIGVNLVSWRRHTGRPAMTYEESIEEALCFGWVDSTARTLDEDRTMLWFSPRKKGSGWSRPNKERVARLEAAGLIEEPGRRVVEAARADGSWSMLDDVENLVVPPDLAEAFARHTGSAEHWEAFPRSAKRGILEWIRQARKPETRARRLEETASLAARGERANQWSGKPEAGVS
jgi:uncharacterized protein YdeI (YjbR/CyaY-like superfamily)